MLFASPDRDLLECFGKLFECDGWETVTVFDGTQVIGSLAKENFDIAVIDRNLPRIEYKEIIMRIRKKNIPVIVLIYEPVTPKMLNEEYLPSAFLPFPFDPEKIGNITQNVLKKTASNDIIRFGDTEINVSGFRIKNGPAVTAQETDAFIAIIENRPLVAEENICVSSLNTKFEKAGSRTRIKYISKKGFVAVTENE